MSQYSQSWSQIKALQGSRTVSKVLGHLVIAIVYVGLAYILLNGFAAVVVGQVDHTTERCKLMVDGQWFQCIDEEGNTAYRAAVQR